MRRGRIGLASGNRPIASFIFLGPTGVGKTELAKTLAEIMFGRDDLTIRLDMSEYMEKHEVAKLIGAPPGYVGYEEGGQLTEAVRAKPYSIVLLDEVEKAHPDVFNILLQILEDGRLTDNKGNTISFKNTIIVATSNLGSSLIQKYLLDKSTGVKNGQPSTPVDSNGVGNAQLGNASISQAQSGQLFKQTTTGKDAGGVNFAELNKILLDEMHKFFKPELLNRFDELVVFKPLSEKDMAKIAKLNIAKTSKLLKEQGFDIQISDKALNILAMEGYDPVYGARPLRRLIQSSIENPIALQIISKKFVQGDVILVDYDDVKAAFVFVKTTPLVASTTPPVQGSVTGVVDQFQNNVVPGQPGANINLQAPSSTGSAVGSLPTIGITAQEPIYGQSQPLTPPPATIGGAAGGQMSPIPPNINTAVANE